MKNELIRRLKLAGSVINRDVRLSSGAKSQVYIDVKKAYGNPETFGLICDMLQRLMDPEITAVAGFKYGGLPLAAGISLRHNLKLVMVRPGSNEHGMKNEIDGYTPTIRDRVALVDDVFTTGGTLKRMVDTIQPEGAKIAGCYVVIRRTDIITPTDTVPNLDLPLRYLLNLDELVS